MTQLNRAKMSKELLPFDVFPSTYFGTPGICSAPVAAVLNLDDSKNHKLYTYDLGAICRKPAELTAFSLFRRDTKAEL